MQVGTQKVVSVYYEHYNLHKEGTESKKDKESKM